MRCVWLLCWPILLMWSSSLVCSSSALMLARWSPWYRQNCLALNQFAWDIFDNYFLIMWSHRLVYYFTCWQPQWWVIYSPWKRGRCNISCDPDSLMALQTVPPVRGVCLLCFLVSPLQRGEFLSTHCWYLSQSLRLVSALLCLVAWHPCHPGWQQCQCYNVSGNPLSVQLSVNKVLWILIRTDQSIVSCSRVVTHTLLQEGGQYIKYISNHLWQPTAIITLAHILHASSGKSGQWSNNELSPIFEIHKM